MRNPDWRGRAFRYLKNAVIVLLLLGAAAVLVRPSAARFTDTVAVGSNVFNTATLAAPTGVSASGGSSITINWTATSSAYASGHRVYRSSISGGPYSLVAQVTPRTTVTYNDSPAGGKYYYVVRAYFQNWESANSAQVSATRIEFVKNVGTSTSGPTNSALTLTVPASGVPAGHLLVVRAAVRATTTIQSITDSRGNSYFYATGVTVGAGNIRNEVWRSMVSTALQSGDIITVTWWGTDGNKKAFAIDEFAGVSTTVDASSTATGAGTTPSGSVTTVTATNLVIGYTGVNGPNTETYTEASGWIPMTSVGTSGNAATFNIVVHGGYKIVSSAGTHTHDPTLGTSRDWAEVDIAFRGQ
jgi:hypothetical protein